MLNFIIRRLVMTNDNNEINTKEIEELKKRIAKLEEVVEDFMGKWGPGVQEKRKRRDEVWDEMVRVLTVQNKRNS